MDVVLKGILMAGPHGGPKLQGPSGNETKVLWLVTNGLIVMLGGMEDEVFNPKGGIPVVYWDVSWMFMALVNGLDVFCDGRENVVLLSGKGVYCETSIRMVEVDADGILMVGWDVVWTKG